MEMLPHSARTTSTEYASEVLFDVISSRSAL